MSKSILRPLLYIIFMFSSLAILDRSSVFATEYYTKEEALSRVVQPSRDGIDRSSPDNDNVCSLFEVCLENNGKYNFHCTENSGYNPEWCYCCHEALKNGDMSQPDCATEPLCEKILIPTSTPIPKSECIQKGYIHNYPGTIKGTIRMPTIVPELTSVPVVVAFYQGEPHTSTKTIPYASREVLCKVGEPICEFELSYTKDYVANNPIDNPGYPDKKKSPKPETITDPSFKNLVLSSNTLSTIAITFKTDRPNAHPSIEEMGKIFTIEHTEEILCRDEAMVFDFFETTLYDTRLEGIVRMGTSSPSLSFFEQFFHPVYALERFSFTLSNALLRFQRNGITKEILTDTMGAFTVKLFGAGYDITIEKDGFQSIQATMPAHVAQVYYADFMMCKNSDTDCPPLNQSNRILLKSGRLLRTLPDGSTVTPLPTRDIERVATAFGTFSLSSSNSIGKYASFLITWLYSVAGGIAILMTMVAGLRITTSGSNIVQKQEALERLQALVPALLYIFGSWALVGFFGHFFDINLLQWYI